MVGGIGARCCGAGTVGERSALIVSVRLSPYYVVLPKKSENRNGNCEQGCRGKSILNKSSLSG